VQVQAKIHQQQSIISIFSKKTQQESIPSQYRSVQTAMSLGAKHRVITSKPYQVAVKSVNFCVALSFRRIKFCLTEQSRVRGIRKDMFHVRGVKRVKLAQELDPPLMHFPCKSLFMVRKILKRAGCGELLALEQHRGAWTQEHESGHCPIAPWTGELVAS
jgi:hypothetical protein